MAVLNLFPFQYRELRSDGLQLWWLLRSGEQFRAYYAQWERYDALKVLYADAEQGRRPREWDAAQVGRATALRDGLEAEATAAHWAFYWAVDSGDWPESGCQIGRALELLDVMPPALRVQVLLDAAYYDGLHRRDAASARRRIAEAADIPPQCPEDESIRQPMALRAAAALLAVGHFQAAKSMAMESLLSLKASAANNIPDQCLTEHLISCCAELD